MSQLSEYSAIDTVNSSTTQRNTLLPEEILSAEFQYIAHTAFQANEDRARVGAFYFAAVGGFAAAAVSSLLSSQQTPVSIGFMLLFTALSSIGIITVIQLARLRNAWFQSVAAMNKIKEYYCAASPRHDLWSAFLWSNRTLPPRFAAGSVGFLSALQVIILDSLTIGAAIVYGGIASGTDLWFLAVPAGAISILVQILIYRWYVRR